MSNMNVAFYPLAGRARHALLVVLTVFCALAAPHFAHAACNLRPGVSAAFDGDQGSINRPFSGPGESVEISLRQCDSSPGLNANGDEHNVTVIFTPETGLPTAVVLAGGPDCSGLGAELSSCAAAIGGKATCVAGADAALEVVDRNGTDALSFRFPDTDARCNGGADAGTPCSVDADCASNDCSASVDGRTLSGAAAIVVTDASDPLACGISDCASASGTLACVDRLYAGSGSCSTENLGTTFPGFTSLPSPNVYAIECVDTEPPCNPLLGSEEVKIGLDVHGNALIPFLWDGVREQLEGEAVARIVRATIAQDIEVPGQTFVASFSPEGRRLDPVFEPKTGSAGSLTLFGSTDAPYTILRVANGSDQGTICVGGANDAVACNEASDCTGGTCDPATCVGGSDDGSPCSNDSDCTDGVCGDQIFDFSVLTVDGGQGPAVLSRLTSVGNGICELDVDQTCTVDCGADGDCVNYKLEASTPVPLDGLIARDELANYAVTERVDGIDLNNDGDTNDLVMTIRDGATGDLIPLGAPAASCGIPADGGQPVFGRAVVRSAAPPLLLPAGAADGQTLAFLEPESGQNNCDINSDDENDDAYLRLFDVDGTELAAGVDLPADEATVINDRALVIEDNKVYFRTNEGDTTDRVVLRRSNDPGTSASANGFSSDPEISEGGAFLVFTSRATDLTSDPVPSPQTVNVFRYNYGSGSMTRVSQNNNDEAANVNCFRPSIRSNGKIAFDSSANNLRLSDQEGQFDLDSDVFTQTSFSEPQRISDTNAGGDPDGDSCCASIGASGTAFVSDSTNLIGVGEDTNSRDDIYFKPELGSDNLIRISDTNEGFQANGHASFPDIAESVLVVAFESRASNYVAGDTTAQDIFVYDGTVSPAVIEKVSVDANGGLASSSSARPRVSGDGRYVAFDSLSNDLVVGDTNGVNDVFVRDRWLGTTRRVSVSTGGGQADGASYLSGISADGRYIVFSSEATDLISDDTNGNFDVFIHDAVARTTIRTNVTSGGLQVTGDTFFQDASVSNDATIVVWETDDSSYTTTDTNGEVDIYSRENSSSTAADINGDGSVNGNILRFIDLQNLPNTTEIDQAGAAKIASGNALLTQFMDNLNFEPTSVPGFRFWDGSAATTLGFTRYLLVDESDAFFLTPEFAAVIDDEASLYDAGASPTTPETTDANGDGDSFDGYLAIRDVCSPISSCGWSIPTGAGGNPLMVSTLAEPLGASANYAVFVASEAEHGAAGTQLNGDGDTADEVIHVYDHDTSSVTNLGVSAVDFVIGEPFNSSACGGDVHLMAFRASEEQEGANLNGDAENPGVLPPDIDEDDFVIHVYDLVSDTLVNVGQAARPCAFPDCDPRTPYRIEGSKIVFLTLESDQGGGFGQDLSGEGDTGDLVVQSYDYCADVLRTIERVEEDSEKDPTDIVDDSRVITTLAGRCDDGPCTVGGTDCDAGSYCEADVCLTAFGLCSRHLSIACTDDTDCARCIDLYPGSCESDEECSGTAMCLPQEITAVESTVDADGDGVIDTEDGCPDAFDPSGNDLDGDGVPDACDLQSCRPFPRGGCKSPGDGKVSLLIRNDPNDKKDKLLFKWGKGDAVTKAEFGNPLSTDTYELCIYSNGLLSTGSVPPGGTCDKNDKKPCWKEQSKGFKYKDPLATPAGITSVQFKEGTAGKAKVKVGGKGGNLNLFGTDSVSSSLIVQFVNNSTGECFDAGFDQPFQKQTTTQLKAKGGVPNVTTTTTTTLPPCPDNDSDGFLDAACGGADCYDNNPLANPLQTGYFTVDRGDGSFDYDCNGTEDKLIGPGRCLLFGIGFCFESGIPGLLEGTDCGQSGPIVIDCNGSCDEITSGSDVEECR